MFHKYSEQGYVPIPIVHCGKNPIIKKWDHFCREKPSESLISEWQERYIKQELNIGITCGPASGIIVLDIDTDDKEFLDACPRSPVVRRGAKGEARFFRYDPSIQSRSFPKLDILADGRQILVPPSIHPETKMPYVWLTPDTLDNIRPHELPIFTINFLDDLRIKFRHHLPKGEGRNNRLKNIVSAMRTRGEAEEKIIDEILEQDRVYHHPRLFLDQTEGYHGSNDKDARRNAHLFVNNITDSLLKAGVFIPEAAEKITLISGKEEELDLKKFDPRAFTKPDGLMGEIMDLILSSSVREMPNLALGGSISLMSALCSNRYRYDTTWPNTYVMNLANTGAGKSFPQSIIKTILAEELNSSLLGYGDYRSGAAFVKNLVGKRERLDVIDEISALFSHMKEGGLYQSEIQQVMCKAWSESNQFFMAAEYSEKEDKSSCYNPCISVLGSSTIEGIKARLDKGMMTSGLLPRFLIFSHENYGELKKSKLDEDLLEKVAGKCLLISGVTKRISTKLVGLQYAPCYDPINLAPSDSSAIRFMDELSYEYSKIIETEAEAIKHIYTRGIEQVKKLAIVHCVGCFRTSPKIILDDLIWAKDTFETCLFNSRMMFEETNTDGKWEQDLARLTNYFKRHGKRFISKATLNNDFKREPQRLKQLVDSLVMSELIEHAERPRRSGKSLVQGYRLVDQTDRQ